MRRALFGAACLVCAAAGPASARGISFHRLAATTDWGATDGVRYAAFPTVKKDLVIDTRGGRLKVRRLPLARCADGELPWDYVAGGGRLVGQCPDALVIQNLSTGAFGKPPYLARADGFFDYDSDGSAGGEVWATAVGAGWIAANVSQSAGAVVRSSTGTRACRRRTRARPASRRT